MMTLRIFDGRGVGGEGYVLITVLIFLFVLTLLSFTSLNNSRLEMQMSTNFSQGRQLFYAAESVLKRAKSALVHDKISSRCFLPVADYRQKDEKFWLSSKTCYFIVDQLKARYVIEKLATDPSSGTEYFRITAWVWNPKTHARRIVQGAIALVTI